MTFALTSLVMPDLNRHPASVRATAEGSGTPDQVRGDDFAVGKVIRKTVGMNVKRNAE